MTSLTSHILLLRGEQNRDHLQQDLLDQPAIFNPLLKLKQIPFIVCFGECFPEFVDIDIYST